MHELRHVSKCIVYATSISPVFTTLYGDLRRVRKGVFGTMAEAGNGLANVGAGAPVIRVYDVGDGEKTGCERLVDGPRSGILVKVLRVIVAVHGTHGSVG